jgi:hypothetical protein
MAQTIEKSLLELDFASLWTGASMRPALRLSSMPGQTSSWLAHRFLVRPSRGDSRGRILVITTREDLTMLQEVIDVLRSHPLSERPASGATVASRSC